MPGAENLRLSFRRKPESKTWIPDRPSAFRNDKEFMQIKAIIFDMGNVLLNYDALKAARRFSKVCGAPFSKIWAHFFISPTEKAYTRGEISSYEFYRHAKKALHLPIPYKTFCRTWNDIFWENRGMESLLVRLKRRYPLYLISNTNKMHFDHIRKKFKILKHFTKTFPSHEVGCRKPEPKIYRKVIRSIKLRADQTVFIDDMPKFVEGAKKVGMHAICFKNKEQMIRSLTQLGVQV